MFEDCYVLHLNPGGTGASAFEQALRQNHFTGRYELASSLDAAQRLLKAGRKPHIIVGEDNDGAARTLLQWLRDFPQHNSVPVMIYSPVDDPAAFKAAVQSGAIAYLIKSDHVQESIHRVRRILEFCSDYHS